MKKGGGVSYVTDRHDTHVYIFIYSPDFLRGIFPFNDINQRNY